MKTASAIARYLAGVIFLVFGLNGLLNFIPLPPPGGIAGQFMGALYASHYLWVIFAFQVIAGILLLVNRYVPLAVAVLVRRMVAAGVQPITWLGLAGELQRDWARTERLEEVAQLFIDHAGATGSVFLWETQLLGASQNKGA